MHPKTLASISQKSCSRRTRDFRAGHRPSRARVTTALVGSQNDSLTTGRRTSLNWVSVVSAPTSGLALTKSVRMRATWKLSGSISSDALASHGDVFPVDDNASEQLSLLRLLGEGNYVVLPIIESLSAEIAGNARPAGERDGSASATMQSPGLENSRSALSGRSVEIADLFAPQ